MILSREVYLLKDFISSAKKSFKIGYNPFRLKLLSFQYIFKLVSILVIIKFFVAIVR